MFLQESGSVQFNNLVEVEALVVPVCPEHHSRFIQLKELLAAQLEATSDPVIVIVSYCMFVFCYHMIIL